MTAIIGWIFFAFTFIRLMVALINYMSRPYLPAGGKSRQAEKVSVLVPARDEEKNIAVLLHNFGSWREEVEELIIYDDQSTDNTLEIISLYAAADKKIKVIKGRELSSGWLGKNHACDTLAKHATGEVLLFIDADVTITPGSVKAAAGYMSQHRLKLLSVFPTQIIDNTGARLSVPLMNWILLCLLPLPAVRLSPYVSLAAANGQFMMFNRDSYDYLLPHNRMRDSPVEDIAIIKLFKRECLLSATILGGGSVFCKMYDDLKSSVEGFSKNIFDFFGGSVWLTWSFIMVITVAPFWVFIFNGLIPGIIYVLSVVLIRVLVSAASKQDIAANIILMIPQQVILWVIAGNATFKKKDLIWKGRRIY